MDSISESAILYIEAISRFKVVPCDALKAPILLKIELLASQSAQERVLDAKIHRGIKIEQRIDTESTCVYDFKWRSNAFTSFIQMKVFLTFQAFVD